jgi:CheY-like chemotaxis protein
MITDENVHVEVPPVILVVEDVLDTMAFVLYRLRRTGCELDIVADLDEARQRVRDRVFDFLLVDVRIPFGGQAPPSTPRELSEVDAGLVFLHELKSGRLGEQNREAQFAIITSFSTDVDVDALERVQGYTTVVSKTAADIVDLMDVMGLDPPPDVQSAFIARDLLRCDGPPDRHGYLHFNSPGWERDELIPVRLDTLPDDIQQEVAWGDFPVYIWATLNIGADNASDTGPHDFELSGTSEAAVAAFETDAKAEDEIV